MAGRTVICHAGITHVTASAAPRPGLGPLAGGRPGGRPAWGPTALPAVAAPPSQQTTPTKAPQFNLKDLPFADLSPEPWASADLPIEEAATPPSSWYIKDAVWDYEKQAIFGHNWVWVDHTGKLKKPGDFITGSIADTHYVICMTETGELKAFHNVCRHHASPVALEASGCKEIFACPYHGWEYDLDGRFRGATFMKGIKNFEAQKDASLVPIRLDTWGHFIYLCIDPTAAANIAPVGEWLGEGGKKMAECDMADPDLVHVRRMSYDLKCNWKIFVENYLDGCYHCPYAHPGLSQTLSIEDYYTQLFERTSFQFAPLGSADQISSGDGEHDDIISTRIKGDGRGPSYVFGYPNWMCNRYGVWMGTIQVLPTGTAACTVHMDFWVKPEYVNDESFIDTVVKGEDVVQMEDVALCDLVQRGIFSPVYDVGRYAPGIEQAMLHFHQLVNADFTAMAA